MGDSITAGRGLAGSEKPYHAILGERWGREVLNLSRSGLRADEALVEFGEKIDQVENGRVAAAFVVLGANDQLAGRPAGDVEADLLAVASRMRERGWVVFVVQSIVPSRGRGYREAYSAVAEKMGTPLSDDIVDSYLLEAGGVCGDYVHPSGKGHAMIAETLDLNYGGSMGRGGGTSGP